MLRLAMGVGAMLLGLQAPGTAAVCQADGGGPIYVPAPPSQPPAAAPVSNRFTFGKARLNKKRGTASLAVTVPGPGLLKSTIGRAGGHRAGVSAANFVGAAGTVKISIAASGKIEKRLERVGRVKVTVRVVFTPNGGTASTKNRKLTLVKRH